LPKRRLVAFRKYSSETKRQLAIIERPCGFRRKAILILICTNGELVNPNQRRGIAVRIIETQNRKNINAETLVVAVDMGKSVHYGYFRTPGGKKVKPFPFDNTHKGFQEFWQKLSQFQRQQGLKECVIGFESTGPYGEPLFHYLRNQPVRLVQINPMHTKRLKELTGNSPNKTDRKDPWVIADVISLGHALTLVVPEGAAAQLRRLTHAREAKWGQQNGVRLVIFGNLR
jgi:hypothetical protein